MHGGWAPRLCQLEGAGNLQHPCGHADPRRRAGRNPPRRADGLLSGLLIGQAYNLALSVIPKYTVEEYKGAFRKGIAAANAKGVCSIGDGSIGYMGNQWQLLRAFHELEKEGDLNLRFYLVIMDYGYIPFMEGGLPGSVRKPSTRLHQAAARRLDSGPHRQRQGTLPRHRRKGAPSPYPGRFAGPRERYHRGGCQIAIHTNGDNAIEEAINAIERQAAIPRRTPGTRSSIARWRPKQPDRMAKLGIIANFLSGMCA